MLPAVIYPIAMLIGFLAGKGISNAVRAKPSEPEETPPIDPVLTNPSVLIKLMEEQRRILEMYNRPGPLWLNSRVTESHQAPRINPALFAPPEESTSNISLPMIPAIPPMAWRYEQGRRSPMGR